MSDGINPNLSVQEAGSVLLVLRFNISLQAFTSNVLFNSINRAFQSGGTDDQNHQENELQWHGEPDDLTDALDALGGAKEADEPDGDGG